MKGASRWETTLTENVVLELACGKLRISLRAYSSGRAVPTIDFKK